MIYLVVGSHVIMKGKRHFTFQFQKYICTYVSLKFQTNYIVETSGSVLQNRFKCCIVYTFSKIFFSCKIKQLYVGGNLTKESCLTYAL